VNHHEKKKSQLQQINEMPLYPTEDIIWDENVVPSEYYSGEGRYSNVFSSYRKGFAPW